MKRQQAAGENSSGFTNEQDQQGGAFSRDLLDQKSKVPPKVPSIFRAWGPWLQMTSVLRPGFFNKIGLSRTNMLV